MANQMKPKGFTIVELIIVIVVVGILAAISVLSYGGVQDRARQAKMTGDISTIVDAIKIARIKTKQNLTTITGSTYTAGTCTSKASGTNLATLPTSDTCISRYRTTLNAISTASGEALGDMRDPWGRPYLIDENEGEGSPSNCTRDTVAAYRYPFVTGFGAYSTTPINNVPVGGASGCS